MAGVAAIGYLVAAEAGRRWLALVVLALATAVGLGLPAAVLTAGRRIHTAYDRFAYAAEAVDVSVVTPAPDFDAPRRIAALPGVVEARSYAGLNALPADDPEVAGWSLAGFTQVQVAGRSVPAIGIDTVRGDVRPPVTHGSPVRSPDEVVLGAVTRRQLTLDVGDDVAVGIGTKRRTFRVVGSGPMPTLGTILTDHPSLGVGILLDLDALQDLAYPDRRGGAGPVETSDLFTRTGGQASGLLVRTRPGRTPERSASACSPPARPSAPTRRCSTCSRSSRPPTSGTTRRWAASRW